MKHARPRTPKDRDAYAKARIEQMLDDAREGKIKLSKSQEIAIKLRYEKLRASLQAVEQTTIDPKDTLDPAELEAKLKALYDSRPELFAFLKDGKPLDVVGAQGESLRTVQ